MDGASHSATQPQVSHDWTDAFRTLVLAAAQRLIEQVGEALGDPAKIGERFPFLLDYAQAFSELEITQHQPLLELSHAAEWPAQAIEMWLVCGLIEEDAAFAEVFEYLDQPAQNRRPGVALMQSFWGTLPRVGLRPALRSLLEAGVLHACNPGAPAAEQLYEVEENCWAAARGEPARRPLPGVRLDDYTLAPRLEELLVSAEVARRITEVRARLRNPSLEQGATLLVRGPVHNGRASLLAALARAEGRAALHIDWPLPGSDGGASQKPPRWLGAFTALANARPIFRVQGTPGESLRLPPLHGYSGWVGVVCGDDDAFDEPRGAVFSLQLPLPDPALRTALIERHGRGLSSMVAHSLAAALHLSSGHLVRALAEENGATRGDANDVARLRETALASGSAALDSLARRLPHAGEAHDLVLNHELQTDLDALEARCGQRDGLRDSLPVPFARRLNAGVRALFAGPSGTGKTLAAQVLAARLGMPLYRLDLSAVVSKYIGETERNLHRLLTAAEALDVLLLLDEGDALLAKRTDVGNAHDRYANLETNFLLQRLESHRGIVLVTTNALERVDTAFLRRFDQLLNFRAPSVLERAALFRAHLPANHCVTERCAAEVAEACTLTGGQIRNVALSATSAALASSRRVDDTFLIEALRREYRRAGALCPVGRN